MKNKIITVLLILIISFSFSCLGDIKFSSDKPAEGLDIIEEAWKTIQRDFVDSDNLDNNALAEEAIQSIVEMLDDPHTSYLSAQEYELTTSRFRGEFAGIGATVTIKDGQLTIVAPIAGYPAEQAGIKPDDAILSVDGEPTADLTLQESILKIRGPKGTKVTLSVLHRNEKIPVEIIITRSDIELPSVIWEILESDNIALIEITNFSDRTDAELTSALEEIIPMEVTGIIFDFRYNPGGILDAAIGVASQFLEEGIVLYSKDNVSKRTDWEVQSGKGMAKDIPLVILINGHSASASEVVAGALQDYNKAFLIGTTTFGKGSMNLVRPLSNGGALYITNARWYTPLGRQIDRKGITPDIIVELTIDDMANDRDPQLERAVSYLNDQD